MQRVRHCCWEQRTRNVIRNDKNFLATETITFCELVCTVLVWYGATRENISANAFVLIGAIFNRNIGGVLITGSAVALHCCKAHTKIN